MGHEWVRYDVPVRDADTDEMVTMHFERPVFRPHSGARCGWV